MFPQGCSLCFFLIPRHFFIHVATKGWHFVVLIKMSQELLNLLLSNVVKTLMSLLEWLLTNSIKLFTAMASSRQDVHFSAAQTSMLTCSAEKENNVNMLRQRMAAQGGGGIKLRQRHGCGGCNVCNTFALQTKVQWIRRICYRFERLSDGLPENWKCSALRDRGKTT